VLRLLYAPVKNVIECGDKVDISVFNTAVQSFKLIVVIEKGSRLFFVQDLLVVLP
jgi:hypothetical protein